jgi:hypothetical protein
LYKRLYNLPLLHYNLQQAQMLSATYSAFPSASSVTVQGT